LAFSFEKPIHQDGVSDRRLQAFTDHLSLIANQSGIRDWASVVEWDEFSVSASSEVLVSVVA
jgi:hypothetical protein